MSAFDTFVAYKFIKLLTTPFDETEAYERGIIDADGNILKSRSDLKDSRDKKAYPSNIYTLVWNLKKILNKVPGLRNRLGSFAAAMFLLREEHQYNNEQIRIISEKMGFDFSKVLFEMSNTDMNSLKVLKEENMSERKNKIKLISHEIKTPINVMEARYGSAFLTWDDLPEDEKFDIAELIYSESKAKNISMMSWDDIDSVTRKKLQKALSDETEGLITLEQVSKRQIREFNLVGGGSSLTPSDLDRLRKKYKEITAIDPSSKEFKEILDILHGLSSKDLKRIVKADIPYLSSLAKNMLTKDAMNRSRMIAASAEKAHGRILFGEQAYDPDMFEVGPYTMMFLFNDDSSANRFAKEVSRKFVSKNPRKMHASVDGNSVYVDFDEKEYRNDEEGLDSKKNEVFFLAKKMKAFKTESVEIDEATRIAFKGDDKATNEFQRKLKEMGMDKEYMKMVRLLKKKGSGFGLFMKEEDRGEEYASETGIGPSLGFSIEKVSGEKLGVEDVQKRGDTTYKKTLVAMNESVQISERVLAVKNFVFPSEGSAKEFEYMLERQKDLQIDVNGKEARVAYHSGGELLDKIVSQALARTRGKMKVTEEKERPSKWTLDSLSHIKEAAEDDRTDIAKKLKVWAKPYVTGKISVRSGKGKFPYIQLRAVGGEISNELRKMVIDKAFPKANVLNPDDISYGNITKDYIAVGSGDWARVMGLEEGFVAEARYGKAEVYWDLMPIDERLDLAEIAFDGDMQYAKKISKKKWRDINAFNKATLVNTMRKETDGLVTLVDGNPPMSMGEESAKDRNKRNRDLWRKINSKGSVRPIDRERYPNREREGLEGPFRTRSGITYYYDRREGKFYNPDTDMYMEVEEIMESGPMDRYYGSDDQVRRPIRSRAGGNFDESRRSYAFRDRKSAEAFAKSVEINFERSVKVDRSNLEGNYTVSVEIYVGDKREKKETERKIRNLAKQMRGYSVTESTNNMKQKMGFNFDSGVQANAFVREVSKISGVEAEHDAFGYVEVFHNGPQERKIRDAAAKHRGRPDVKEEIGTTTAGVAGTGDDPVVGVPVRKRKRRGDFPGVFKR